MVSGRSADKRVSPVKTTPPSPTSKNIQFKKVSCAMKRYPLGRFLTDPPGVNRSRGFTSSCKLIKNGRGGGCQVLEISYKQFDIVSQSSCQGSGEQQEESFICQLSKKMCFLGGEPRLPLHRALQRTQASL